MEEARRVLGRAFTFDRQDFIACAFWTALGYCLGGLLWLFVAAITDLGWRSSWCALPIIAGALLGARLWWHLRNLGNEEALCAESSEG
jgi:membrane protein DedA with SNARE-associated domain